MPVVSLTDLQKQITQRERELQALRQELENRQNEFARLTSRKKDLQAQLRQVEAEIAALAAISTPQPAPAKTKKATAQAARPAKPGAAAKKDSRPSATVSGAAKATGPVGPGSQPPLREVLTTLLKKSTKLLSARELAAQARAGGYRTNSANFVKVVGNKLGEMDNVDYLPDKGYRLKKTKAKT